MLKKKKKKIASSYTTVRDELNNPRYIKLTFQIYKLSALW